MPSTYSPSDPLDFPHRLPGFKQSSNRSASTRTDVDTFGRSLTNSDVLKPRTRIPDFGLGSEAFGGKDDRSATAQRINSRLEALCRSIDEDTDPTLPGDFAFGQNAEDIQPRRLFTSHRKRSLSTLHWNTHALGASPSVSTRMGTESSLSRYTDYDDTQAASELETGLEDILRRRKATEGVGSETSPRGAGPSDYRRLLDTLWGPPRLSRSNSLDASGDHNLSRDSELYRSPYGQLATSTRHEMPSLSHHTGPTTADISTPITQLSINQPDISSSRPRVRFASLGSRNQTTQPLSTDPFNYLELYPNEQRLQRDNSITRSLASNPSSGSLPPAYGLAHSAQQSRQRYMRNLVEMSPESRCKPVLDRSATGSSNRNPLNGTPASQTDQLVLTIAIYPGTTFVQQLSAVLVQLLVQWCTKFAGAQSESGGNERTSRGNRVGLTSGQDQLGDGIVHGVATVCMVILVAQVVVFLTVVQKAIEAMRSAVGAI